MFTPERTRVCDAREPVTFGECVREARAQVKIRARSMTAVNNGNVEALAQLLLEAKDAHSLYERATGTTDEAWPTWYAEFLLGHR